MNITWLLLIPFLGGLLAWLMERAGNDAPRHVALGSSLLLVAFSIGLWLAGDYSYDPGAPAWTAEFRAPWIERFGIAFHLALDGLGLVMILLTGVLGAVAVLASWKEVTQRTGLFHLNLLWILAGVVGVFLAVDLFLFFVFWEVMLVPMYFLITVWGRDIPAGLTRAQAATKFFIYTQAGGLVMLVSIIVLVLVHLGSTGELTFALDDLRGTPMSPGLQYVLMLGFFIAFAVKLPVVPLHGWLADAHAASPTAGSVDITGLLLKTAAFGMLRFALPLFPEASREFAGIAMALGVITIVYGGVLAFAQTHTKRLIAYASISHMGFILIGIYAANVLAIQGVVVLMLAGALSTAALFVIAGQVHERTGTFETAALGGLWARLALVPPFALFFGAATLGLPGLGNFVGEFMVLFGAWQVDPVMTAAACIGLVLAAVYALALVHRVFLGPAKTDTALPGATLREALILFALALPLLALGLYPQPVLDLTAAMADTVANTLAIDIVPLLPAEAAAGATP